MGYQTTFRGSLTVDPVLDDEFCLEAHLRRLLREKALNPWNGVRIDVAGSINIYGEVRYEENFVEVLDAVLAYLEGAGVKASGELDGEGSDAGGDYWRYIVRRNEYERLEGTVIYS
jgi:hypothetical protein